MLGVALPRSALLRARYQRTPRRILIRASSSTDSAKTVVIIGGTGRVGSSTADALLTLDPSLKVTLASRNQSSYNAAIAKRPQLKQTAFKRCDIDSPSSVQDAIANADLVIHTAGPFQQSQNFSVLEAALQERVPYIDVCDDSAFAEGVKSRYHDQARAAGVPAITSAGIYPGTSNVMAAHIISIARKEYDEQWQYRQPEPGEGLEPKLLRYSYFTAGSGGVGPTILETSFLLAGQDCVVWKDGQRYVLPPVSDRREVDFGEEINRKGIYLYNLPEVQSARQYLRVPGVSARFGTDPPFWNWGMWVIARIVPRSLLNDRGFAKSLATLLTPIINAMDVVVGERVSMRVEVDFVTGQNSSGLFTHKKLSTAVGYSVAAFARSVLARQTQPGVWFPEEKEALADRREFLRTASTGTTRFDLNRPAWMLDSDVKQIMAMIYW